MTPFELTCLSSMKLLLFILPFLVDALEEEISHIVKTTAECKFSVHKGGPEGEEVSGVDLNTELYYRIQCRPHKGFCLRVSNCTVSGDDGSVAPFTVIDENGCSTDSSIFSHVIYESDWSVGIPNPLPIRFRSSSAGVAFYCVTTMEIAADDGCRRRSCPPDL